MSRGKIVVVGANQGALVFSLFTSRAGYEVVLYEAKNRKDVAYDWSDDMEAATFEELGLERPKKQAENNFRDVVFYPPNKKSGLSVKAPEKETDIPVYRRPFNEALTELALESGVRINYCCPVKSAVVSGNRISGVELCDGTVVRADMVVDCGGAESSVRSTLPDSLGIPQKIKPSEMFFVRRTFFERAQGVSLPEDRKNIYLKHRNELGITWRFISPDEKYADILVGRINGLSEQTYLQALADLRTSEPIIGDKVVKGGQECRIPVRRNISRMVANGYALVGDSAFMTIPIIGSGMANSLKAAKMLSDVIIKPVENPFTIQNLYRYQRDYMREIGGGLSVIELAKNLLIGMEPEQLNYLVEKKAVSDAIVAGITGAGDSIPLTDVLRSVFVIASKPKILKKIASLAVVAVKQAKTATNPPEKYNEAELAAWQKKYDEAFAQ